MFILNYYVIKSKYIIKYHKHAVNYHVSLHFVIDRLCCVLCYHCVYRNKPILWTKSPEKLHQIITDRATTGVKITQVRCPILRFFAPQGAGATRFTD